jgi:ABC-type nitrate/sulfonate/bicarbonate transport system substrate-binding protein
VERLTKLALVTHHPSASPPHHAEKGTTMFRGHRQPIAILIAMLAIAGVVTSCSSSSSSSKSSTSELKIGLSAATTLQAELYVAQQEGRFAKYGLKVDLINAGTQAPTQVAAGQIDLAQYGTSAAFAAMGSGRKMSAVYGFANNIARAIIVGTKSPVKKQATTAETVMQLSGKRLVTQGTTGSGIGNATAVSNYIVAHGGKAPSIVGVASASALSAQLVSGQADAGIVLPDYFAAALQADKVQMIVPNTDPLMTTITGGNFPAITLFGQTNVLKSKATAVTALIAALRDAHAFTTSHSIDQVAADLHANSAFSDQTVDTLKGTLQFDPTFFSPNEGLISQKTWTDSLAAIKLWGTGLDLSKPEYSYSQFIDMSYWNNATKLRK